MSTRGSSRRVAATFGVIHECVVAECAVGEAIAGGIGKSLKTDNRAKTDLLKAQRPGCKTLEAPGNPQRCWHWQECLLSSACRPTATLGPTSTPWMFPRVPPVVLLRSVLEPTAVLPLAVLGKRAAVPTAVFSFPVFSTSVPAPTPVLKLPV